MKSSILLMVLAIAGLSSCSVYKSGQTPDDVYYSPAREVDSYVAAEGQSNPRYNGYQYDNSDDRWLRMRVRDRARWSAFDDYDWNDYRYNNWAYNSYNLYNPFGWNSYWNSYWMWNSYYNPYCTRVIVVNPKTNPIVYNRVRNFSLNSYTNTNYNNSNTAPVHRTFKGSSAGYNNSNTLGSSLRKVFSGNSNSYVPSSGDRPSRSYTPSSSSSTPRSSSSSSGSSGSSSSGGGVSRPGRGGH